MGMVSEFKAFIQRGNAIDLAVGVILGGPSARWSPRWSAT